MYDGQCTQNMSAREIMWIVCNHYYVRGLLAKQYTISDLLCMTMPNNKKATLLRCFNAWSEQYHKLPQDQKEANMAVLVEQVVKNARKVVRFPNMVKNYDIRRPENPEVTDSMAMEWLRKRFMQLNDQTRSEYTFAEHLKAVKDTLRGPEGRDSSETRCKSYLQ